MYDGVPLRKQLPAFSRKGPLDAWYGRRYACEITLSLFVSLYIFIAFSLSIYVYLRGYNDINIYQATLTSSFSFGNVTCSRLVCLFVSKIALLPFHFKLFTAQSISFTDTFSNAKITDL